MTFPRARARSMSDAGEGTPTPSLNPASLSAFMLEEQETQTSYILRYREDYNNRKIANGTQKYVTLIDVD